MAKERVERYIEGVLSGEVVCCKMVKKSVERHVKDLKRRGKKQWYFDEKRAEKAIDFIELLKHTKGAMAGQRITLEDWQVFIVWSLFGCVDANGVRRYKYAYIEVPRKNGKTTFAAAIALYMLIVDGEEGAEVYAVATKREQAKICFNEARAMALKLKSDSMAINGMLGVYQHNLHILSKNAKLEALSSDSNTLDGLNPSCTIIDEYHAHKTSEVFNVMRSGMGAREQPLMLIITTAGFDKERPCYKYRSTCINILNGKKADDTLFISIHTIDTNDDWTNPKMWAKANPNLNVSVAEKFIKEEVQNALNNGSSDEVNVKTKNLNIWTDAPDVFIPEHVWVKNTHGFNEADLVGKDCYGGLDFSKGVDFNAFCLFFPNVYEGKDRMIHAMKLLYWLPSMKVKNNKENRDYSDYVRDGDIMTTPGNVIDYMVLTKDLINFIGPFDLQSIAYDRYEANHGGIQELLRNGLTCNGFGQGYVSMNTPTKELEKLSHLHGLEHFGNKLLSWQIGNVVTDMDPAGNIKPNKTKSGNKIDGPVASVMAIGEWLSDEAYEEDKTPGIIMI